jgi:hypothetical protein
MAFPPRPRSSRAEPSFTPIGAAPRDAVPIRPAAPRAAAVKPTANDPGAEREPVRFAAEHRRGVEAQPISLNTADRIIVSSATAGGREKREGGGFFRILGFVILLVLAGIGAYSLYLWAGAFLP